MAESYSVRARLSATDNGFTSTLKNAMGATDSLAGKIKSGIGFGFLTGIGQRAFSALTDGARGLIDEINAANTSWNTFSANMAMLGKGQEEIAAVKSELQAFAEQTIYSASDMATTYSQLAAVGVKNTTKLVKGFGGLAAAAENPQQAMKTLSQQATQMAAKPTVAWQDFKLMLEQTPAGIAAVAREMGMSTSDLVSAVQSGTIATNDFFDAVARVGTNEAFTDLATSYKNVDQAMAGLTETLGNKLGPAFQVLSENSIGFLSGIIDKLGEIDAQGLADKVSKAVDKAKEYWGALQEAFDGTGTSISGAVKAVKDSLSELDTSFGDIVNVENFKGVMEDVAGATQKVAGFIEEHSDTIAKAVPWVVKLGGAYAGFKVLNSVVPGMSLFTNAIGGLAKKGISGLAGKLFGVSKAQDAVGESSASSGTSILQSAAAFLMMGVAVLAVAGGIALLAQSAIALSSAGGLAIGIMVGMAAAVAALGFGMVVAIQTLAPMSGQLIPVAAAFLALGAAVLMVSAGFALLAMASINLASAGAPAIAVMVGMVVAIAALMAVAAALGPALTAGAAGLIAFGAAMLMVGAGALLAGAGLALVSMALPLIVTYGTTGASAIITFGTALMAFGVQAAAAGAGVMVLGAGLLVAGAGMAVLAAAMTLFAVGAALASVSMLLLSVALPKITSGATESAAGLVTLAGGLTVFAGGAALAGAAALVLGAGMLTASAGILLCAAGMTVLSAGVMLISMFAVVAAASITMLASALPSLTEGAVSNAASLAVLSAGLALIGSTALLAGEGVLVLGAGLIVAGAGALLVSAGLMLLSVSLTMLSAVATQGSTALMMIGTALLMFSAKSIVAGAAALTLSAGLLVGVAALIAFGAGAAVSAAGMLVLAAGLKGVNSQMKSIANNAKTAQSAISSMQSSLNVIQSGLKSLGTVGSGSVNKLINTFNSAAAKASSAGQKLSTGFVNGVKGGMSKAPAIASQAVSQVNARLRAGAAAATSAGRYISIGFANGMLSMLATVRRAATQLVAEADRAIQAKAKIGSPSRLTDKDGKWFGQGWINGITSKVRESWEATANLVVAPDVAVPNLANAYGGEIGAEYEYYRNSNYVIEVPVVLDGKEIARTTAPYTQSELDRRQTRTNRKLGYV